MNEKVSLLYDSGIIRLSRKKKLFVKTRYILYLNMAFPGLATSPSWVAGLIHVHLVTIAGLRKTAAAASGISDVTSHPE